MRRKTDENLHPEVADLLRSLGHDVKTVWDEGLRGKSDRAVIVACRREGRALVTLDLDFANILRYPPERHAGLIVLRVADQSRRHVLRVIERAVPVLAAQPLAGRLWMVDEHHVRSRPGEEP